MRNTIGNSFSASSGNPSASQQDFSSSQLESASLQNNFFKEATHGTSLASMMMGGLAYRLGKIATLQSLGNLPQAARFIPRILAPLAGLSAEVTAFQGTSRFLESFSSHSSPLTPHDFWQSWRNSFIDFGVMKGVGHLLRASNVVTQHFSQDLSMVAGHTATAFLGWTPHSDQSFAQQMMHAEVTNIQLGVGTHLAGLATRHRLQALERNLEQQLEIHFASRPREITEISAAERLGRMASPPSDYEEQITRRLGDFPLAEFRQLATRTQEQWRLWTRTNPQDPLRQQSLETFLVIYAQVSLAHFGNQTPRFLEFNEDIYQLAKLCFESGGLGELKVNDRHLMIRFLSQQPGRIHGERNNLRIQHSTLPASSLRREELETIIQDKAPSWKESRDTKLREHTGDDSERTRLSQRSDTLFESYIAYLHAQQNGHLPSSLHDLPFQEALFAQCLEDAAAIPYPDSAIQVVRDYLRASPEEMERVTSMPPPGTSGIGLGRIPLSREAFTRPLAGEKWFQWLERNGVTRTEIDQANLGIGSDAVFDWGFRLKKDASTGEMKPVPPGSILDLLTVVAYINSRGRGLVDPFDAVKLTHIEQLEKMKTDEDGNIIIRYPKLLDGVETHQFTLATLLQNYLNTLDAAGDGDLAKQWGVSASTVREYRNGNPRRMNISILRKLHEGLCPKSATPEQRDDLWNLLMFLRYRPYFDASIPILMASTGEMMNRGSALSSDQRVVLVSTETSLRELDLSRRVPFEKDPFAAVMDHTADRSLELLDQKLKELELVRSASVVLPERRFTFEEIQSRVGEFRVRHARYKQQLNDYRDKAVDLQNNLLKPGQVREMENFYYELFRFTEMLCIQALNQGKIHYSETEIDYVICPPNPAHPKGVKLEQDRANPKCWRAYVVIEDILGQAKENTDDFNPDMVTDLVELRVLHAYQAHAAWFNGNPAHNQDIFEANLRASGFQPRHPDSITWHNIVSDAAEAWNPHLVERGNDPILHRIKKNGRGKGNPRERREEAWGKDLKVFANEMGYASVEPLLQRSFERYREDHPAFMTHYKEDAFSTAILTICEHEEPASVEKIERGLKAFLQEMGLPCSKPASAVIPPITEEGFANILFATYLQRFHALNPVKGNVGLVADDALMEEVFTDRIGEATQFSDKRENIFNILRRFIETYNQRPGLLIIRGLTEVPVFDEPFPEKVHIQIFARCIARLQQEEAGLGDRISRQHIFASMGLLRNSLRSGETVDAGRIQETFALVHSRLAAGEVNLDPGLHALHRRFLEMFCHEIQQELIALNRLADLVPAYVVSKGYESGLEQSQTIGTEVQRLFIEYATSAVLESRPVKFKEVVARHVDARYSRYDKIREEVSKDLQTLLLHSLRHYREQYDTLERNLENALVSAREHASVEQFWNDFVDTAQRDNPTLSTKDELLERVEDLSRFLPHVLPSRSFDLSEKIRTALAEIEALAKRKTEEAAASAEPASPEATPAPAPVVEEALDPAAILAQAPSREMLETLPELTYVEAAQIEAQSRLCPRIAHPGARDLLQILAFLRLHAGEMNIEANHIYDDLALEIATESGTGRIEDPAILDALTQKSRKAYEEIRTQARPLTLLRFYPEIQREGQAAPATDKEAGIRLTKLLSEKDFPANQNHEAFAMVLGSGEPYVYHEKLAKSYTQPGSALRTHAQNTGERSITPYTANELSVEQNRWIDCECPELYLVNWADLLSRNEGLCAQVVTRYSDQAHPFATLFSNPHYQIMQAINRMLVAELHHPQRLSTELKRMKDLQTSTLMLVASGANPNHVALWAEREVIKLYASIREKVRKDIGITKIVSGLPEIAEEALPANLNYPGFAEVSLRSIPDSLQTGARLAQRLARSSDPALRIQYENILLEAEPLEATLPADRVTYHLERTQRALAQLYFENREKLREAEEINLEEELQARRDELARNNQSRFELNLHEEAVLTRFRNTFERLLSQFFQNPLIPPPFAIAEMGLEEGSSITGAIQTSAQYNEVHKALDKGQNYYVTSAPGSTIEAGQSAYITVPSRIFAVKDHGLMRPYLHLQLPVGALQLLELAEMVPGLGVGYRRTLERGAHWLSLGVPMAKIQTLLCAEINRIYRGQRARILEFLHLGCLAPCEEISAQLTGTTRPQPEDVFIDKLNFSKLPEDAYNNYCAVAVVFGGVYPEGSPQRNEFLAAAQGKNNLNACTLVYLKYRPEILRFLAERNAADGNGRGGDGNPPGSLSRPDTAPPPPTGNNGTAELAPVESTAEPVLAPRLRDQYFSTYPELEIPEITSQTGAFAGDVADIGARLIFILKSTQDRLDRSAKKTAKKILGIAARAPQFNDPENLAARMQEYDKIRGHVLRVLDPIDRVRILPEFRLEDGSVDHAKDFGRRMIRHINERIMPEPVEKDLIPYIRGIDPKKTDKGIPALHKGFARAYLNHRERHQLDQAPAVQYGAAYEMNAQIERELRTFVMPGIPLLTAEAWQECAEQICARVEDVSTREALQTALSNRVSRGIVSLYHYSDRIAARIPEWRNDPQRNGLDPLFYLETYKTHLEAGYTPYVATNIINGGISVCLKLGVLDKIHRYQKDPRMNDSPPDPEGGGTAPPPPGDGPGAAPSSGSVAESPGAASPVTSPASVSPVTPPRSRAWPITALEARVAAYEEIHAEELLNPIYAPDHARLAPSIQEEFLTTARVFRRILRLPDDHPVKRELLNKLAQFKPKQSAQDPDEQAEALRHLSQTILGIYDRNREALKNLPPAERENIPEIVATIDRRAPAHWELQIPVKNPQATEHTKILMENIEEAAASEHDYFLLVANQIILHLTKDIHDSIMADLERGKTIEQRGIRLTKARVTKHGPVRVLTHQHRLFADLIAPKVLRRIADQFFDTNVIDFVQLAWFAGDMMALGAPPGWVLAHTLETRALPLFRRSREKLFASHLEPYVASLTRADPPFDPSRALEIAPDIAALAPAIDPQFDLLARCARKFLRLPADHPHRQWFEKKVHDLNIRDFYSMSLKPRVLTNFSKEVLCYYADHAAEVDASGATLMTTREAKAREQDVWKAFPELSPGVLPDRSAVTRESFSRNVFDPDTPYLLVQANKILFLSHQEIATYRTALAGRCKTVQIQGEKIDLKGNVAPVLIGPHHKAMTFMTMAFDLYPTRERIIALSERNPSRDYIAHVDGIQTKYAALVATGIPLAPLASLFLEELAMAYQKHRRKVLSGFTHVELADCVAQLPEFDIWQEDSGNGFIGLLTDHKLISPDAPAQDFNSRILRILTMIAFQENPRFQPLKDKVTKITREPQLTNGILSELLMDYLMARESLLPLFSSGGIPSIGEMEKVIRDNLGNFQVMTINRR